MEPGCLLPYSKNSDADPCQEPLDSNSHHSSGHYVAYALVLCTVPIFQATGTVNAQPRVLVVRVSDYWSRGLGFDSRLYHGDFSLKGKIPMVTMVWAV
jgi:hypothetical protein